MKVLHDAGAAPAATVRSRIRTHLRTAVVATGGLTAIVLGVVVGAMRHFDGSTQVMESSNTEGSAFFAGLTPSADLLSDSTFVLSLVLVTVGGMVLAAALALAVLVARRPALMS